MRCSVLALLLVCGLLAQGQAFTLQSSARVNIVPALEIQQVHSSEIESEVQLVTAIWESGSGAGSDSSISFAINGPPDLWANITLVDLATEVLPPGISAQEVSSDELKVIFPLPAALDTGKDPRPSLLLRVEYE